MSNMPCRRAYASIALAALVAIPLQPALARPDHDHHDRYGREHVVVVKDLPRDHTVVRVGHESYFFHGGHYYVRQPNGFVVVRPPAGAVIATLPVGFVSITIGGAPYFVAGDAYYRRVPEGYLVVDPPVVQPGAAPAGSVVVQAAALNVRSGPGPAFPVLTTIAAGQQLLVLGTAPGWYYVQLPNNQVGWVMTSFTTALQPTAAG